MQLPIIKSEDTDLMLMETRWAAILNPLLANKSVQSSILSDVVLSAGWNTINHKLGRKLIGWRIIGINAASSIYDGQASNPRPELTLTLNSSAGCTVQLEVF
jgi:hypothetical protein